MATDPQRLLDLDAVFTVARMKNAWQRTVRQGLRRQTVLDLHDYLDVHRNIDALLTRTRSDILASLYRPREPEIITVEKRIGICRRMVVPCALDAVVLQTVVNVLEPHVQNCQPCLNAYYSRSHDGPAVEDFDGTFGYPWWLLWPRFQTTVWDFAKTSTFTVTTDVANYFDCIPLRKLRDSIASRGPFSESLMDFLFFLLEAYVWRPDYIPLSGVGLPQLNFDAPRLLAHQFLFPADRWLEAQTSGRFVRWMDDIDFGADTEAEAMRLLGELDLVLATLGVRLNSGKSHVLDAEAAARFFWIDENVRLNVLTNLVKNASPQGRPSSRVASYARAHFNHFAGVEQKGHAEKIHKRYFTLFTRLLDPYLERQGADVLAHSPGLRPSLFRYLGRLGPTQSRADLILDWLSSGCVDDTSFFGACQVLVEWELAVDSPLVAHVVDSVEKAVFPHGARPIHIASALWVLAKYAEPHKLATFVLKTREKWRCSSWTARQVASCVPVMAGEHSRSVRQTIASNGLLDALQVVTHLDLLSGLKILDHQLRSYLLHAPVHGFAYPLPKVLLAYHLLRGSLDGTGKTFLRRELLNIISDPVYRAKIGAVGPLASVAA